MPAGKRFAIHLFAIIVLSTLAFTCQNAGAWTAWTLSQHDGHDYVPLSEVADFYGFNLVNQSQQMASLIQPGKILRGQPGTRDLYINNVRFYLAAPLLYSTDSSSVLISRRDLAKIVDPVLRPWMIHGPPVGTIILDPGHGGKDQGTWCSYGTEKVYALDVASRVRNLLTSWGYQVVLTRSDDTFVSLDDRINIANQYPDGLFVSIHFNAGPAHGIETYCLAPEGVASSDGHPALTDFIHNIGNDLDAENVALATAVHGCILQRIRTSDRGVRRARFHVLRENRLPAILVEGGYLSGGDAYAIATGIYRQYLSVAIAEGIVRYLRAVPTGKNLPSHVPAPVLTSSPVAPLPSPTPPVQTASVASTPPAPAAANQPVESPP